jgi:hypothetical protein
VTRCQCISYNQPRAGQTVPTVVLANPFSPTGKTVCIDACIAEPIQTLWKAEIETVNSCCSHGCGDPEVILRENSTLEDVAQARRVLAKVDSRDWAILSWTLVRHVVQPEAGGGQ